jgi:hypothetical protein
MEMANKEIEKKKGWEPGERGRCHNYLSIDTKDPTTYNTIR